MGLSRGDRAMTDEMVERVARAIARANDGADEDFDGASEEIREVYRGEARAAIEIVERETLERAAKLVEQAGYKGFAKSIRGLASAE